MAERFENQSYLIAVREDCGQVIAFIGKEAGEELAYAGWTLEDLEIPHEDSCMTEDGLFVWEGALERNTFKYDEGDDGVDIDWHGTFRPAHTGDFARFGLRPLSPADRVSP